MSSLKRTSLPTLHPVTLVEVKDYSDVDGTEFDDVLNRLIPAATRDAEDATERTFITTTWTMKLDGFPSGGEAIVVLRPPLSSVTSVQYIDADGSTQTWSSSSYDVDTNGEPGRIALASGQFYPATEAGSIDSVTVTFVGGYGATEAAAVTATPESIKLLIREIAKQWLDRENGVPGTRHAGIQAIINSERVQVMV